MKSEEWRVKNEEWRVGVSIVAWWILRKNMNYARILRSSLKMMLSGCFCCLVVLLVARSPKTASARFFTLHFSLFTKNDVVWLFCCLVVLLVASLPTASARFPPFPSSLFPKAESATVSGALPPDIFRVFLPGHKRMPEMPVFPPFFAFSLDASQRNP